MKTALSRTKLQCQYPHLGSHIFSYWHIPSSSFCPPTAETCLAHGNEVPFCYEQQTSSQCVDQRNVFLTDPQQLAPVVVA